LTIAASPRRNAGTTRRGRHAAHRFSVYRLLDTGELEVTDSVKRPDGSWSEFGRTLLKRK
jgi:hypothetical protein